jgi:hypothetical protein
LSISSLAIRGIIQHIHWTTVHHLHPQFVGLFMAKAILESAARGKELGTVTLNLAFAEPFWKLLLGIPLNLMDLQVGVLSEWFELGMTVLAGSSADWELLLGIPL